MFDKKDLEALLEKSNIKEVIGSYIELTQKSSRFWGCCPFHIEKTPSFCVSVQSANFKCFGCGEMGDVIDFLKKYKAMTFQEAVEYLSIKFNFEIKNQTSTQDLKNQEIFEILKFAENYFNLNLFDKKGKDALEYLYARKISNQTIKKFKIGYALNDWDYLYNSSKEKNFSSISISKSQLFLEKENLTYDRFRNRIIFPIKNISGKCVGFGARTLQDDGLEVKYINSPENEIFEKRKCLYGIFEAKSEILKQNKCFLTEGYFDVLAMSESGFENSLACMGTAISQDHISLILKYTKNVTIIFDGDLAGINSAMKNIEIFLENGIYPKVVLLEEDQDPHSFFLKNGKEKLKEFIEKNEVDFITFKSNIFLESAKSDPLEISLAITKLNNSLCKIQDNIYRSIFTKKTAEILKIDENILIEEQNKFYSKNKSKIFFEKKNNFFVKKKNTENSIKKIIDDLEFFFLKFLIKEFDFNDFFLSNFLIQNMDDYIFSCKEKENIWIFIKESIAQNNFFDLKKIYYCDFFSDQIKKILINIEIENFILSEKWTNFESFEKKDKINLIVLNLKLFSIKNMQEKNLELVKNSQNSIDFIIAHKKLLEFEIELKNQIKTLSNFYSF